MANTLAPDVDRLPWLSDERVPSKNRQRWWLVPLALTFVGAVAVMSFWLGSMGTQSFDLAADTEASSSEVTTALPLPAPANPAIATTEPAPMPKAAPAPQPAPVFVRQQQEVRIASERAARRSAQRPRSQLVAKAAPVRALAERKTLQFSNPWESAEASGRMVRVGTYSTLLQGKKAWSRLAGVYPAMKTPPGGGHRHPVAAERPRLLPPADRNDFTGPFRSALPADEGDRAELRGRGFGGCAKGQRG